MVNATVNVCQGGMGVMVVVVQVLVLLLPMDRHGHMGAGDAAADGLLGGVPNPGQTLAVEGFQKRRWVWQQL